MKKKLLFLMVVLYCTLNYAQVGIGTTTPDPSSILEVESSTLGMLTPRMTTAQRNAIASPANGLLVYDTDFGLFYFYDNTSWQPLSSSQRNNYKLVKDVSDLSAELTAGGGTEYLLDTNTLYEINGTINLAVPINLNDAYISGEDTNEDILVATSNVFTGANGGSVRNLTLVASSGSIFNLSGSGTENLIVRDAVIANSASVGSISNFDLAFFSIVQYLNNTTGITYSNINQLLLNSEGWSQTNSGTYQTFTGTFDVIAKQGGFSEVVGATAAIDVTGISSISGGGTIRNVDFFGGGNYINGTATYTNYNFNTDWDVDCAGIPVEKDAAAAGNFYYDGAVTTGFTQSITNGTAVEVEGNGTFTSNNLFRFNSSGGNNRLTYEGTKDRQFQINATLSVRVTGAAGNFYAFFIAKNGTVLTESRSIVYIDNDTQIQNVALNENTILNNNDFIEIYVQRLTGSGTDSLIVFSENLSIN